MRGVKYLLAAGAVSLMSSAVLAADLPIAPPPAYFPPPPQDFGGWYLRGDIGMTNQRVRRLDTPGYYDPAVALDPVHRSFDSAGLFGIGVGYTFNNWFRADITGEYRGRANFHGLDVISDSTLDIVTDTDEYTGSKSEWLVLANAYVDLGTWWNVTPFVGAGIGASRNTFHNFMDVNTLKNVVAYAPEAPRWNFAWALHAGLAYQVTPNLAVELAYRYVSLGKAETGGLVRASDGYTRGRTMTFDDITSHDVKLGVRWSLDPGPVYLPPPPPLVTKG